MITEKTIQRGDLYAVYKCTESTHQEERFREEAGSAAGRKVGAVLTKVGANRPKSHTVIQKIGLIDEPSVSESLPVCFLIPKN